MQRKNDGRKHGNKKIIKTYVPLQKSSTKT